MGWLARPAGEISVGDVLTALEGSLDAVTCPGLSGDSGETCAGADLCVTKYVWQRINESIARTVNEITLEQLAGESRKMLEKAGEEEA